MLLQLQASSSRLVYTAAARSFSTTPRALAKAPLRPTKDIPTPAELFTIIGRGAEKRLAPQAESWDALNAMWVRGRAGIKDSGLGVKDRRHYGKYEGWKLMPRYVLWALSRFSQGDSPSEFIEAPKPAKKFRGWGPKVQQGVRVR